MANLAEQLRNEYIEKCDFQKYLDYVAEQIRAGKNEVWFGLPWNDNCKGIKFYTDINLAESLVLKFRNEGFRVAELRANGFSGRLLQFEVTL